MHRMGSRLDALPPDIVALLLNFLSGFDLLPLSHVNRHWYHDRLAPNGAAWSTRLPGRAFATIATEVSTAPRWDETNGKWYTKLLGAIKDLAPSSWETSRTTEDPTQCHKRLYLVSSSLRFPGCDPGTTVERQVGSAVRLWDGLYHAWNADAFSIDVWFALLPATRTNLHGGILFGGQRTEWPGINYTDDLLQFLHVDPSGDLYCSMGIEKSVVASQLKVHRWYHVAVSFDRLPDDWWTAMQCVYLDGELVHKAIVTVHRKWRFVNHAQIGTGVIDGDAPGSPSPMHRGWYCFNGVLDDVRFWEGAITSDQAKQLFQGQEELVENDGIGCAWSMKRDGKLAYYGSSILKVRSTRPREVGCIQLRGIKLLR